MRDREERCANPFLQTLRGRRLESASSPHCSRHSQSRPGGYGKHCDAHVKRAVRPFCEIGFGGRSSRDSAAQGRRLLVGPRHTVSAWWGVHHWIAGQAIAASPAASPSWRAPLCTLRTIGLPPSTRSSRHDAYACYRALLEQGYAAEQIALAGDSAGGGLALSLCLRLRHEGFAQPGCLALISPWADLTLSQLADVPDGALRRASWLALCAAAYRGVPRRVSTRVPALCGSREPASNPSSICVGRRLARRFQAPCQNTRCGESPGLASRVSACVARFPALRGDRPGGDPGGGGNCPVRNGPPDREDVRSRGERSRGRFPSRSGAK
jgi:alpha/beta hydrolase fold